MNQGRKLLSLTLATAILALCLAAVNLFLTLRPESGERSDVQYVLYLGTNDQDTNEPVCSPEDAKEKATDILVKHFGGYTIQEADGGWKDGEKLFREYTLVIYLSDTSLEEVHRAADELIQAFHQSSVLIQANETRTEFYAGSQS